MPHRHYYQPLAALLLFSCALFHKPTDLEKGIKFYRLGDFTRAARHFDTYVDRHPRSDSGLYLLYDCYRKLNLPEQEIPVLEGLARNRVENANVYLNLFEYYRRHGRYPELYNLLIAAPPSVRDTFDHKYPLTRRGFAEIACGAAGQLPAGNPVTYALIRGYLNILPDGGAYPDDPVSTGNLIILLDRLVPPLYPKNFYPLKNMANRSFLYLPYMRLIELGVMDFDPALNPDRPAAAAATAATLGRLKAKGFLR
jgi:tetratricopeptide (TPR) repeat protein